MEATTLVLRNLRRNPRRTLLSMGGVAVAIFVFVALRTVVDGMTSPVRQASRERLLGVREKARANVLASQLSSSLEVSVGAMPGVEAASGVLSALALVGDDRIHVFIHGVDPETYRRVRDFTVPDEAWRQFAADRGSAIVGGLLAQQLHWQEGQPVELKEQGLSFTVRAVLPVQDREVDRQLLVHRTYLQSARRKEGVITALLVKPAAATNENELAAAIDQRFSTSEAPTLTVPEAAYAGAVVEQFMGFLRYLEVIGLITILVTLMGAINAFSISVRERIREIGLLRTLGYPPAFVVALVVAESMVVALVGGAVGAGLALAAVGSQAALVAVPVMTLALAAGAAALIGALGGLFPAVGATRMSVVDALRIVD